MVWQRRPGAAETQEAPGSATTRRAEDVEMFVLPEPSHGQELTADTKSIRSHNASVLAHLIWERPDGISRADLSRRSGLSRSTVSSIVAQLLESGLVYTSHLARTRSGRPPEVLQFDTAAGHIIGVEMGASHLSVVLCDLRGVPHWHAYQDCDVTRDPEGTLALMGELIDRARAQPSATGALVGIGVAVPCPVDSFAPDRLSTRLLPAWAGVRLAAHLYERYGARVFVDNDANCGALAEAWRGAGRDLGEFSYIKVATGVGAGHVVAGRPYRGFSGIAGEIGHSSVDPNGRRCRCGLRGCLEAEIGWPAIEERLTAALAEGRESCLSAHPAPTLAEVVLAARRGDALAVELVRHAGRFLGLAVANLLNILNPGRVIIGGRLAEAGDALLNPLRETVAERALWTSVERADVVLSRLGEEQEAVGAATLVLTAALDDLSLFFETPAELAGPPTKPISRMWPGGGGR